MFSGSILVEQASDNPPHTTCMQLCKLKERMKEVMGQVQQVERRMEDVRGYKAKVSGSRHRKHPDSVTCSLAAMPYHALTRLRSESLDCKRWEGWDISYLVRETNGPV